MLELSPRALGERHGNAARCLAVVLILSGVAITALPTASAAECSGQFGIVFDDHASGDKCKCTISEDTVIEWLLVETVWGFAFGGIPGALTGSPYECTDDY